MFIFCFSLPNIFKITGSITIESPYFYPLAYIYANRFLKFLFMCLWCQRLSFLDPLSESASTLLNRIYQPAQLLKMQHSGNPFVPLLGKFHLKAQTFILLFLSCVFGILATKPQSILFSLYVKVLVYSNNQDMEFENSGVIAGGFPCGSASKESACSAGDMSLIPGLGRSPGEGKGYPLQYCGLENSKDCIVCKESDPTE